MQPGCLYLRLRDPGLKLCFHWRLPLSISPVVAASRGRPRAPWRTPCLCGRQQATAKHPWQRCASPQGSPRNAVRGLCSVRHRSGSWAQLGERPVTLPPTVTAAVGTQQSCACACACACVCVMRSSQAVGGVLQMLLHLNFLQGKQ